jgi:hypothetical protein
MKNLKIDFDFEAGWLSEVRALSCLFNYLCFNVKIIRPVIFTCFDDEIPKGYSERYRVLFSTLDGDITYSFFFSSRTRKVYVFRYDQDSDCVSDRGCFYKFKIL